MRIERRIERIIPRRQNKNKRRYKEERKERQNLIIARIHNKDKKRQKEERKEGTTKLAK